MNSSVTLNALTEKVGEKEEELLSAIFGTLFASDVIIPTIRGIKTMADEELGCPKSGTRMRNSLPMSGGDRAKICLSTESTTTVITNREMYAGQRKLNRMRIRETVGK